MKRYMKNKLILSLVLIAQGLFFSWNVSAQQKLEYWDDPEGFLQEQASIIYKQVFKVLDAYPPSTEAGNERKLALFALDALLHDTRLDNGVAFKAYADNNVHRVLDLLQAKKAKNTLRYIHFYNDGYIIQSPTVTIGIDLVRGGSDNEPFVSNASMQSIVDRCDVLFISHEHGDHADLAVAKMFCDQKKEVIVPPGLWENVSPYIKPLRGNNALKETVYVTKNRYPLVLNIYPGYQGATLNNVYAITIPEGKTLMHTGDESSGEKWLANVKKEIKIDVLTAQCWMSPMPAIVASLNPGLVITGHENEMAHTIDHREPYWLSFRHMEPVTVPYVIMTWGEFFDIKL
ncbi:hypothetical protein FACS189430_05910 [Bacteroidia bacterium]|nr:hypothetical protein FACS189430_05910 [Bacteroidia bacterium]